MDVLNFSSYNYLGFGYHPDVIKTFVPDNYWIEPIEVANAIVGLCSGYCDAVNGQTITVDRGTSFFDNFMDMYARYKNGTLDWQGLKQR